MSEKLFFRDEQHGGLRDGYLVITPMCQRHEAVLFIASVTLQLIKLCH